MYNAQKLLDPLHLPIDECQFKGQDLPATLDLCQSACKLGRQEDGRLFSVVVTLCSSNRERPRVHHGVQHGRSILKLPPSVKGWCLTVTTSLHGLIDSYIVHIIHWYCMKLIWSVLKITSRITVGQLAALFQRVDAAEMNDWCFGGLVVDIW